jgi:hypothetical protein
MPAGVVFVTGWQGKKLHCKGVSLNAANHKANASAKNLIFMRRFRLNKVTNTFYPANSFDVVWAIEAFAMLMIRVFLKRLTGS